MPYAGGGNRPGPGIAVVIAALGQRLAGGRVAEAERHVGRGAGDIVGQHVQAAGTGRESQSAGERGGCGHAAGRAGALGWRGGGTGHQATAR